MKEIALLITARVHTLIANQKSCQSRLDRVTARINLPAVDSERVSLLIEAHELKAEIRLIDQESAFLIDLTNAVVTQKNMTAKDIEAAVIKRMTELEKQTPVIEG